jgi:UDP-N-acetylglucosamine acyltransferase
MTRVHPTAVVDAHAELATGVTVAPYSIIGPEVRIAEDVEIGAHVVLEGRVSIGARSRIGHGAVIGGVPQDLKYRDGTSVGVRIGEDTVIREHVTIHRATHPHGDTRIGDHCLIMASSHVAHDCVIGDHVIMINYAALTGHVIVEDRATVGGLTGVHPFARIGAYAYIGGCSKIVQDVPPFIMVDGAPATARAVNLIGMRRGGIDQSGRRAIKTAFRILYRAGLAPSSAAARIKSELGDHPLVGQLLSFIEASRLGIVRAGTESTPDDADEEREP